MQQIPFKKATFLLSALNEKYFPDHKDTHGATLPEIAFIGRSNVGKSSLINHLLNIKDLAKVSGKPGKTRLLNFFKIDEKLMLVDLPGYGYASVSKKMKANWARHIENYLENRKSLKLLILLLDIRRTPNPDDLALFEWATYTQKKILLVFTKADKVKDKKKNVLANLQKLSSSDQTHVTYTIKRGDCRKILITEINNKLKEVNGTDT